MHHALQNGNTPLILAAESGSVAVVKELLRAGAVVDNVNNVTSTGCWYLCRLAAHCSCISLILQFGHPAVLRAARKGHLLVVQMLLEVGADFDEDFLNGAAQAESSLCVLLMTAACRDFVRACIRPHDQAYLDPFVETWCWCQ
jgi:ankyrin repeat protein